MRLSNKYGGLQFFAVLDPGRIDIVVNGSNVTININSTVANNTFAAAASNNSTTYTINSNNQVVWYDGKFLAYNNVIVLGSDQIVSNRSYTTVGASTMSKSYDLSTSSKWANLADGEHIVKLKAKGTGFGTSSFSNSVTVTKGSAMPVKGDLITIESKQYRVLKVNNSVAEVLAMYNSTDSQQFNKTSGESTYANSLLDVYLSQTFYNSLSTTMQNAIVAKTFRQDSWDFDWDVGGTGGSPKYVGYISIGDYEVSLITATFDESIIRKCYALSVQDVIDYLGVTTSMTAADTTLTAANVWAMFLNQTTSGSNDYLWLRSACVIGSGDDVFDIRCPSGLLRSDSVTTLAAVRPAFQIDLSKIEWSPVGGVTEHTLTFNNLSTLTVTVDGAAVTSPYTLTKDCTIVAAVEATIEPGLNSPTITVNDEQYTADGEHEKTVNISNSDVSIFATKGDTGLAVTINYTA